jgi:hypothetical protein
MAELEFEFELGLGRSRSGTGEIKGSSRVGVARIEGNGNALWPTQHYHGIVS